MSCWESKQDEYLCRSSRPKGSLKKFYETFRRIHKKTIFAGMLFLIKLSSVDPDDCINCSERGIGKQNRNL